MKQAERPRPRPPLAARPTQLSVTEIEHWLRDPYTIYAKHILRLPALEAVDTPPGAADRGSIIHAAISDFAKQFADKLPGDPEQALVALGEKHFAPHADFPEARAFWWPRFRRIAHWFAMTFDPERRHDYRALHAEIRGELTILKGEPGFKLTARADRIEHLSSGCFAILDYKTGTPPSENQVRTGLSPQLTLEAAILRHGGFKDIDPGVSLAELTYVRLRGTEPAGEVRRMIFDGSSPDAEADKALERLTSIAEHFAKEETTYLSLVHPMWTSYYGDYDHLARVKEWSATGGSDDGGEA